MIFPANKKVYTSITMHKCKPRSLGIHKMAHGSLLLGKTFAIPLKCALKPTTIRLRATNDNCPPLHTINPYTQWRSPEVASIRLCVLGPLHVTYNTTGLNTLCIQL